MLPLPLYFCRWGRARAAMCIKNAQERHHSAPELGTNRRKAGVFPFTLAIDAAVLMGLPAIVSAIEPVPGHQAFVRCCVGRLGVGVAVP